jgi:hypothetical protein
METETIDKLFLELSQVTKAKTAREIELEKALEDANGMVRSAGAVVARKGVATNWDALLARMEESLQRQHAVLHPEQTARVSKLTGRWRTRCCVCGAEYAQGSGSTQCCGSVQEVIWREGDARTERLRRALVGLVGAETKEELESMEAAILERPGIDPDRLAVINAIHALLAEANEKGSSCP